jgi:hypothetical protein
VLALRPPAQLAGADADRARRTGSRHRFRAARGPIDECMRRYAERAPSRHPVHVDSDERRATAEKFARSARPIGWGPVITVDTTRPVDIQLVGAEGWRLLCVSQPAVSRGGEPVSA